MSVNSNITYYECKDCPHHPEKEGLPVECPKGRRTCYRVLDRGYRCSVYSTYDRVCGLNNKGDGEDER